MENIASQASSFSKTAFDPLEFIGKSDNLSHCSSKNFACPPGNVIHQPGHKIHQSWEIRLDFLCTLYMHFLKALCLSNQGNRVKFVQLIGLHAVQFGNNWMKKFYGQPKLEEAIATSNLQWRCVNSFSESRLQTLFQINLCKANVSKYPPEFLVQ